MPSVAEHYLFLKSWMASPNEVGAVAPSSESLARLMTQNVVPGRGPVIELGPGTGVFTRELLRRGVDPADLVLVEKDPRFAQRLRVQFPEVLLFKANAAHLKRVAPQRGAVSPQCVISGIPLMSLSVGLQFRILSACFDVLDTGGSFFQFTYHWRSPFNSTVLQRLNLRAHVVGRVWRNIPPAKVYRVVRG